MQTAAGDVTRTESTTGYALGYTDAEQERLIQQATLIAPHTERLFREACDASTVKTMQAP